MTDGPGPWGPPQDEGRDRPPTSPYGSPPAGQGPQGSPPPDPYGAPPQGGEYAAAPGYQAAPAGYYPPSTVALPPGTELASWGSRAGALLIDWLIFIALTIPAVVVGALAIAATTEDGADEPSGTGIAVLILMIIIVGGIWLYNQTWMQGKKGATWGKQVLGIRLVRESDLQPIGGGLGIARYFLRWILGNATCSIYTLLTYLWPLWDEKKQTIDDKILKTLVVRPPK